METMPKTKSLQFVIDRPLRNSRHGFGNGHLEFVTDKMGGKKRNLKIWDILLRRKGRTMQINEGMCREVGQGGTKKGMGRKCTRDWP